MFILYAVLIGLLLGLALGGRPAALGGLQLRWSGLFLIGLVTQLVLFFDPVSRQVGQLGVPIYVGSTGLVLGAVLVNVRTPGMPIVAMGASSNFSAILANGGYMPADPGALASLGRVAPTSYSNSSVVSQPMLSPLTDIFALPSWLPLANIFSVGDVLIGIGVAVVIVAAMRRLPSAERADVTEAVAAN